MSHTRDDSDPLANLNNFLPVEMGGSDPAIKLNPWCKVCKSPNDTMKLINYLLATGSTYADVERMIEPINLAMPEKDRISYHSIRNHQKNHLPYDVDAVRRILERRAAEANKDFERGADNILNVHSYAEVMMNKAFAKMVDEDGYVSPADGLRAAEFMHKLEVETDGQESAAQSLASLNRIIQAVRAVVPQKYWQRMMNYLDEEQQVIDGEVSEDDDEEEEIFDEDFEDDDDSDF